MVLNPDPVTSLAEKKSFNDTTNEIFEILRKKNKRKILNQEEKLNLLRTYKFYVIRNALSPTLKNVFLVHFIDMIY